VARATIRGVRDLSDRMAWFDAAPHNELLGERAENEAYCRARPGVEYAVYFPEGGRVTLELVAPDDNASLVWVDVLSGRWTPPAPIGRERPLALEPPGTGHWMALVREQGPPTPPER
jgi:hypothetical protein